MKPLHRKAPGDQEVQTKNSSYCEYITMLLVTRNKILNGFVGTLHFITENQCDLMKQSL